MMYYLLDQELIRKTFEIKLFYILADEVHAGLDEPGYICAFMARMPVHMTAICGSYIN